MQCPKCGSKNIDWFLLTSIFHPLDTHIGECLDCGYRLTVKDKKEQENKAISREVSAGG